MDINGCFSSFSIIVPDDDYPNFMATASIYKDIVDVTTSYCLQGEKEDYHVIQLDAMYECKDIRELCRLICNKFPFLALKQEGSQFILVSDAKAFRNLLQEYTKDRKAYFFYDMLTTKERYQACVGAGWNENVLGATLHYTDDRTGNQYELNFGDECIFLFSDETEVTVSDDLTGEVKELDMLDGLHIFKFHVAVLRNKS